MTKKIISLTTSFILLFISFTSLAFEEPLMPEEAFKFDAVVEGDTIRASWTAADDYYLYRDKIRFESGTPGVELGEPVYPAGKLKHGIKPDGTEGEVETYMHTTSFTIPIKQGSGNFTLIAHSQGCAEKLGICYPPQKREKTLTLASAAASSSAVAQLGGLSSQLGLDSAQADAEPLMPEDAFKVSARTEGKNVIVTWTVAPEYYMYKEQFKLEAVTPGLTFGAMKIPPGKWKQGIKPDGTEGEVETYSGEVRIEVPYTLNKPADMIEFVAIGQGCAEVFGICYPPQKRPMNVATDGSAAATSATTSSTPATAAKDGESSWDTVGRLLFAFLSGLALTFTPCVLPMLPIISSIIAGQGEHVTKTRGGTLAGIYVLGTAVVWTAAGAVAGATGEQLQAYTSHPYFLIPVAVVLVLLSFAMFGFFNLQMPAALQSKATEKSTRLKGGTFAGVFTMGVLASVIAGACVSPILILNLAVAMEAQDPVLGGGIMLMMALGMGVPIILVGIGAGWLLPKAGTWMDTVKYVFGAVLIALAIYILSLIDWIPVLYFWAPFLIITGVYMGAMQSLPETASGWRTLWKGFGLFLIIWGIFALLGAMQGNRDILRPVSLNFGTVSIGAGGSAATETKLFQIVPDVGAMEAQFAAAKSAGKPVFLDYYATWCTDCNIMAKNVFNDAEVQQYLKSTFVVLKADVTDQFDARTQPLKDRFKVFGPPAMLFFDKNGELVEKVYGKLDKAEFLALARKVAAQ